MKRVFISIFITLFLTSCNLNFPVSNIPINNFSETNHLISDNNYTTKAIDPKPVNFKSQVEYQPLETTLNLPDVEYFDLHFKTDESSDNTVKIPESGTFTISIKTGNQFRVNGNTVEIPQGMYDGYISIADNKNIVLTDELYYIEDKLKKLENGEWYHFGNRAFPISQELSKFIDTPETYVLNFKNNGIKELLFRFYKTDKFDYPLGTKKIGVEGGNIELPGVGKLEIPVGALSQDTVVSLRQELQGYKFTDPVEGKKIYDYASPLLRIEPQGLTLNTPASVYLDTDSERLGNNTPYVIEWFKTQDKINWDDFNYSLSDINDLTSDSPGLLEEFNFVAKHIPSTIEPNDNYKIKIIPLSGRRNPPPPDDDEDPPYIVHAAQTIDIGNNILLTWDPDKHLSSSSVKLDEIENRTKEAYKYFKKQSDLDPAHNKNIKIEIDYGNSSIFGSPITYPWKRIILPENMAGLEHELWHVFQYEVYSPAIRGIPIDGFLFESSAEYMGASVFHKKTETFASSNSKDAFINNYVGELGDGLYNINKSFPYKDKYWGTAFMTYLGKKYGDKIMIDIIKKKQVTTLLFIIKLYMIKKLLIILVSL